jgi:hypothetical protein
MTLLEVPGASFSAPDSGVIRPFWLSYGESMAETIQARRKEAGT